MTDHDERGYMTPEELGRFLTLHPLTLWWWRVTPWGETGPAYVRDHGQIRYPTAAVATWLEARYHPVQDGLDDLVNPKPTPMRQDLLARLQAKTATIACPECGAVALSIRERYDPTRPEPPGVPERRLAYGPSGRPLWAWCGQCGARGRVAEVPK